MKLNSRIKIIRTINGCRGAEGKIGVVTDEPFNNGLCRNEGVFNVRLEDGSIWCINEDAIVEYLDDFEKDILHKQHSKPYIICSAVHVLRAPIYKNQPRNIECGFVITGRRHSDCYNTMINLGYDMSYNYEDVQGFLTSDNVFLDRRQAYKVALEAGQIDTREHKLLISEDLY